MVDIKGYEKLYAITEDGRVWSYRSNRFLKPYGKDYLQVVLCNKGVYKQVLVHRLVAEAYIPNPNNYPFVNHKDENKKNPDVSNLEWCTASYNVNFGTRNEKAGSSIKKTYYSKIPR